MYSPVPIKWQKKKPLVAVSVTDKSNASLINKEQKNIDVVELRIDHFSDKSLPSIMTYLDRYKSTPLIATIRTQDEGGKWHDKEDKRSDLFKVLIPFVSAIDVEAGSPLVSKLYNICKENRTDLIISKHFFTETPPIDDLCSYLEKSNLYPGCIPKIATMINSFKDLETLTSCLLNYNNRPCIVIGMGPLGRLTRLYFPAIGSCLTFASLGEETAPGQLPLDALINLKKVFYPQ